VAEKEKIPIAVLIGGGSKLPAIIKASQNSKSKFKIALVITHKKKSPGVELAIKNKIPAVFFNLPDYRRRVFNGSQKARANYNKLLGWFISQKEYSPKLLVFVGWDLIMDENFFDFFKNLKISNGYAAINLHPALMKQNGEKNKIHLPDGSKISVIKGEQQLVLETVLKKKHTYFGPSVHFMNPKDFDSGTVIVREFIKTTPKDSIESLRKKLMPVEDRILIEAINTVLGDL